MPNRWYVAIGGPEEFDSGQRLIINNIEWLIAHRVHKTVSWSSIDCDLRITNSNIATSTRRFQKKDLRRYQ